MNEKDINKTIALIGVKSDCGASISGADGGVMAIREAGLKARVSQMGFSVHDIGNINPDYSSVFIGRDTAEKSGLKSLKNLAIVNSVNTKLYYLVRQALKDGELPLVLGGDHSLAAGSVIAAANHYGKIGVIWVDAHGDFNNQQSSPSGNIHGMPLSAVTGNGPNEILPFNKGGFVDTANTVVIGARALDSEEKIRLKKSGVTVFTMHEIDTLGMAEVVNKAVEIAGSGTDGIYLSLDLDAFDPALIPEVGTPVEGGLTFREGRLFCEIVAKSKKLIGMDIVELNPKAGEGNNYADIDHTQRLVELGHIAPAKSDKADIAFTQEIVELSPLSGAKPAGGSVNITSKSALVAVQMICAALGKGLM